MILICHRTTIPYETGVIQISKNLEIRSKLQRRRRVWVGEADFEKKKQKQKKPPLQMSKLIILTSSYELWNLAGILLTLLTASMTVDLPTLNTGLEYEFPWAKRYRQKARTFFKFRVLPSQS